MHAVGYNDIEAFGIQFHKLIGIKDTGVTAFIIDGVKNRKGLVNVLQ